MKALVVTSQYHAPEHRAAEVMSPELALVDPVLATSARLRLPETTDSLFRTIPVTARSSTRDSAALIALATAALDAVVQEPGSRPRGTRSRSFGLLAGVAAASAIVLVLLDVHVQVGRTPAAAETAAISKPPVGQPTGHDIQQGGAQEPSSASGQPGQRATPKPQRFAWAPTDNASGYHIELFRDSSIVFSADTSEPQVTIPAGWRQKGQQRSLVPGEYRWYVWPVVSGQRASKAIVQAKLVVPSP